MEFWGVLCVFRWYCFLDQAIEHIIAFFCTYVEVTEGPIASQNLNIEKYPLKICNDSMMTSSNGSSFRVTGHLCWEFTGHRRRALVFSLICTWINGCVNNREAGDLRHHRVHYDVTVMQRGGIRQLGCLHLAWRIHIILEWRRHVTIYVCIHYVHKQNAHSRDIW